MLSAFRRERLAEAAQNLAARGMRGEAAEPAFMEIIRYFPEDSVQDDLAFGWGAPLYTIARSRRAWNSRSVSGWPPASVFHGWKPSG